MLNVTQQIGGTIGLAALVTVASTGIRNDIAAQIGRQVGRQPAHPVPTPAETLHALAHGWGLAFEAAVVFAAIALVAAIVGIRVRPEQLAAPGVAPVAG